MTSENAHFEGEQFERLSGYVDGELTQQEAQKVELLLETDPGYQKLYDEISLMRQEVQSLSLQEQELEHLDKLFNEPVAKTSKILGFALIAVAALIIVGVTFFKIFSHPDLGMIEKLLVGAIGSGSLLLLYSVLRQRLISARKDKYKRVKI